MSDATTFVAVFAAVVAFSGLFACEDRGANEARQIAQAITAFEQASPTDRPEAFAALKAATCSEAEACTARDACVSYGTAFMRARTLMDKARSLGPEDGGGNGAATESERAIILASAQDALKAAEDSDPACQQALERLHVRASRK